MKKSYKTLSQEEYNVLVKIARKTKTDCWFLIRQDCHGTDYVYDLEEGKRMCLRSGVELLTEALDCQENYDNCCLTAKEEEIFKNLLEKLKINFVC